MIQLAEKVGVFPYSHAVLDQTAFYSISNKWVGTKYTANVIAIFERLPLNTKFAFRQS